MSDDLSYLEGGFVINDRYEIERSLGAGGFAVVYGGRDTQIDRSVAIKVMNASGISTDEETYAELVERFEREAKLAAKVEHPNVATIFDYGVVADHEDPFIIMEMMEGRDLDEQLATHGPMVPDRALDLLTDTLVAVGLAHEAGIVHKDLKPSNLFLKKPDTRFETLSILDFGIAHITKAVQARLTQAGEMTGTPGYIPPEYASEQVISPPLDVYQMGLVLVETLTGEMVVDHDQPSSALLAHVQGELPVPVAYLDSPLGPILRRALASDPEARYSTGLEFADDLSELSSGAIPQLGEDPEMAYLSEHGDDGPAAQMSGASTNEDTQHLYGSDEPASADDAGPEEGTSQTQYMYGGPADGDEAESTEPSDIESAPTLPMDGEGDEKTPPSASGPGSPVDDAQTDDEAEVELGTRFDLDDPEESSEPVAADHRGSGGSFPLAAAVVALLGGGIVAYFLFGGGTMSTPSDSGSPADDQNSQTAAAAAPEPEDRQKEAGESASTEEETEPEHEKGPSNRASSGDGDPRPTSGGETGESPATSGNGKHPPAELEASAEKGETPPAELEGDDPNELPPEKMNDQAETAASSGGEQSPAEADDSDESAVDPSSEASEASGTDDRSEPEDESDPSSNDEEDVEVKLPSY